MATNVDNGSQRLTFDFKEPANGSNFNKLLYDILKDGLYGNMPTFTRVNDTSVEISTFQGLINDTTNQLCIKVKTESVATAIVSNTEPLIIARYTWSESTENYVEIKGIADIDLQADDIILGKCNYSGSVLIDFDYSLQQNRNNETIKKDVVGGEITTVGFTNLQLVLDTTLGSGSHTVGDPVFLGQEITLSNNGTGFATFINANDFSYGIIVDADHDPVIKAIDDGVGGLKWDVGSQVSAEYIDTGQDITQYTDRKAKFITPKSAVTTGTGVNNAYGSGSGTTYIQTAAGQTWIIPFLTAPIVRVLPTQVDVGRTARVYNITPTNYDIRYFSPATSQSVAVNIIVEGEYA